MASLLVGIIKTKSIIKKNKEKQRNQVNFTGIRGLRIHRLYPELNKKIHRVTSHKYKDISSVMLDIYQ
jgi:hypothetical protein